MLRSANLPSSWTYSSSRCLVPGRKFRHFIQRASYVLVSRWRSNRAGAVLELDLLDEKGEKGDDKHVVRLVRTRLNATGYSIGPAPANATTQQLSVAVRGREGCRVRADLSVPKAPSGSFHFATGKAFRRHNRHKHDAQVAKDAGLDFSHRVAKLSFGRDIKGLPNATEPFTRVLQTVSLPGELGTSTYFIKLIPGKVTRPKRPPADVYQFTYFADFVPYEDEGGTVPGVFFKFELSYSAVHNLHSQGPVPSHHALDDGVATAVVMIFLICFCCGWLACVVGPAELGLWKRLPKIWRQIRRFYSRLAFDRNAPLLFPLADQLPTSPRDDAAVEGSLPGSVRSRFRLGTEPTVLKFRYRDQILRFNSENFDVLAGKIKQTLGLANFQLQYTDDRGTRVKVPDQESLDVAIHDENCYVFEVITNPVLQV